MIILAKGTHELHKLWKGQLAMRAKVIENNFDQTWCDGIFIELRYTTEIVHVQKAFVSFGIASAVTIELVEPCPQCRDLFSRKT